jgi:hypothetical protein
VKLKALKLLVVTNIGTSSCPQTVPGLLLTIAVAYGCRTVSRRRGIASAGCTRRGSDSRPGTLGADRAGARTRIVALVSRDAHCNGKVTVGKQNRKEAEPNRFETEPKSSQNICVFAHLHHVRTYVLALFRDTPPVHAPCLPRAP